MHYHPIACLMLHLKMNYKCMMWKNKWLYIIIYYSSG